MINWCLTPTLVVFQLYSGVKKLYYQLNTLTIPLEIKHTCQMTTFSCEMMSY
jgi:hypothetical protein